MTKQNSVWHDESRLDIERTIDMWPPSGRLFTVVHNSILLDKKKYSIFYKGSTVWQTQFANYISSYFVKEKDYRSFQHLSHFINYNISPTLQLISGLGTRQFHRFQVRFSFLELWYLPSRSPQSSILVGSSVVLFMRYPNRFYLRRLGFYSLPSKTVRQYYIETVRLY